MNREQGKEIVKMVADAYPNLEFTKSRAALWVNAMEDDEYDFETIKKRVLKHITTNRFSPTLADILNPSAAKRRAQEQDTMSPAQILNRGKYDTFVN